MRVVLLAILAAGCSNPKPREPDPAAAPSAATAATGSAVALQADDSVAFAVPTADAFDTAALTFVDVPALRPPNGVRRQIGLTVGIPVTALSPTGDIMAIAGGLDGVQLIHLPTGRGLASRADLACVEPSKDSVGPCQPMIAFSRDGRHLAVWWPLTLEVVQLAVPSGKTEFKAKVDALTGLSYVDDGRLIVLSGDIVQAIDAAGARSKLMAVTGHPVAISPDGRQLVVESSTQEVQIVEVPTGRAIAAPAGSIRLEQLAWSRGGDAWVAPTQGEWPDIVTWRRGERTPRTLATSNEARSTAGGVGVHGFAFPAPYDQVYVGMSRGIVSVTLDGKPGTFRSEWLHSMGLGPGSIARTRDGLTLLSGICALRLDAKGQPLSGPGLCGMRPSELAFDGDKLVSTPWDGGLILTFNWKTGALIAAQPTDHPYPANSATLARVTRDPALAAKIKRAFSLPDVTSGTYQLSRDARTLFVQGIESSREAAIIDLTANKARTGLLAFTASGDGSRIAQQRLDREDVVDVRTVKGNKLLKTLTVQGRLIARMALSTDGKLFVTEGEQSLEVFDVATGRRLFAPPCRGTYTGKFALSIDASLLVCDTTSAVEVYSLLTRKRIKRIEHADQESVDAVALSDDNKHLAISNSNIWIVDL
jgi:WD40 repeat protein